MRLRMPGVAGLFVCAALHGCGACCNDTDEVQKSMPPAPMPMPPDDGHAAQGAAAPMVDAMPVSVVTNPDGDGMPNERVHVVTVRLDRELEQTQLFEVHYEVQNSNGVRVEKGVVVKAASPASVSVDASDPPEDSFKFRMFTTNGRLTEIHKVRVRVTYRGVSTVSAPFEARPHQ